jgi:hypothetical protein
MAEEEMEKQGGDVLKGPLADVKAKLVLNGAIPFAV